MVYPIQPRYIKKCARVGCERSVGPATVTWLANHSFCCYPCSVVPFNSRTRKILELFQEGKSSKEIAYIVGTSPQWTNRVRMRDIARSIPDGPR